MDDAGYADVGYADPSYRSTEFDDGLLGSMMERAVAEQIAEQRLIREALTDFDRRLELLERTVVDRVALIERESAERTDRFERAMIERMSAFETVLKRIVDRLTTTEERIVDAVDHGGRVTRTQLDALRPMVEASVERMAEVAEESERILVEAVVQARRRLEATVQEAMETQLQEALAEFRESLEGAERKIRRDVNRVTFAIRGDERPDIDLDSEAGNEGGPAVHAERVGADSVDGEAHAGNGSRRRRRRRRPLRARPSSDDQLDEVSDQVEDQVEDQDEDQDGDESAS